MTRTRAVHAGSTTTSTREAVETAIVLARADDSISWEESVKKSPKSISRWCDAHDDQTQSSHKT
jgi:hypothetical protein